MSLIILYKKIRIMIMQTRVSSKSIIRISSIFFIKIISIRTSLIYHSRIPHNNNYYSITNKKIIINTHNPQHKMYFHDKINYPKIKSSNKIQKNYVKLIQISSYSRIITQKSCKKLFSKIKINFKRKPLYLLAILIEKYYRISKRGAKIMITF